MPIDKIIDTLEEIRNEVCNEDEWVDRYYDALTFCINMLKEKTESDDK